VEPLDLRRKNESIIDYSIRDNDKRIYYESTPPRKKESCCHVGSNASSTCASCVDWDVFVQIGERMKALLIIWIIVMAWGSIGLVLTTFSDVEGIKMWKRFVLGGPVGLLASMVLNLIFSVSNKDHWLKKWLEKE